MSDPSEASVMDVQGNKVTRRLKHFSGYLVGVNDVCDAFYSSSCASVLSFNGYLVGN
jgi:hypothetical protein